MAGGKRYKFQGTQIRVLTDIPATGGAAITAVTKASPAQVTATAHGFVAGDIVHVAGIVGMTELNGGTYVVLAAPTADTFTLAGVDSQGYGTYTSGGTATKGNTSNFCELTGYSRDGGTSPEIDATTICSDAAEFEVGLPNYGSVKIDFNFAPNTSIQKAIEAAYKAGTPIAIQVVLPNNGGSMVLMGTIQQTSEQASVGGLWKGSLTIKLSGNRIDLAAA